MYIMVNTSFINYLDQIDNLTETLEVPILMDKTTFKQTLPISLNASKFYSDLLSAPRMLKDFIHQYKCKREIFYLEERHVNTDKYLPDKISFQTILLFFLFVTAVISVLVMTLAIYLLCKHKKLRMLVTGLALQQMK